MRAGETDLWLMQKYDNGDFYIYRWTRILAKKGYTVLRPGQAKPLLKLQKIGKNNVKWLDEKSLQAIYANASETDHKAGFMKEQKIPELTEDKETQAIVAEAVAGAADREAGRDLDKVSDIHIDQEDIQIQETKFIKSLQHKTSLESHMLEKYQVEIPMGKLDNMKTYAKQMINDLAKDGRLFLVDGGVAMR